MIYIMYAQPGITHTLNGNSSRIYKARVRFVRNFVPVTLDSIIVQKVQKLRRVSHFFATSC